MNTPRTEQTGKSRPLLSHPGHRAREPLRHPIFPRDGDRVIFINDLDEPAGHGTVVETIEQRCYCDLHIVDWDGRPHDTDMYPSELLDIVDRPA